MRSLYPFIAATALSLSVAGARADDEARIHRSITPERLATILGAGDDRMAVTASEFDGDAILDGEAEGALYSIYFYNCGDGGFTTKAKMTSECLSYEYRAYFDDYPDDGETINAFNAGHHFGALWRDPKAGEALALHLPVVVEGGVTEANIRATYRWWRETLRAFVLFMEDR